MVVTVRLFATLRERAGADRVELDLRAGARAGDAIDALGPMAAGLSIVIAVNREYADRDQLLRDGDEVAAVPPVSGGAGFVDVSLTAEPLSLDAVAELVRNPRAGAVVVFSGVTRDAPELVYEAYQEMAQSEMQRIAERAVYEYALCAAAIVHRVGSVLLSEASVLVAASAPHRPAAFAAARQLIDEVKAQVPIWKREDGNWKHEALPRITRI